MKNYGSCSPLFLVIFVLTISHLPAVAQQITHGPILGRLGSTEIGVWARTDRPGEFRVRYGTSPDALRQTSLAAITAIERDNTGWVHIRDLQPDTKYYYELMAGSPQRPRSELGGSFRTLPTGDQFRHPQHNPKGLFNFSFEYACGNNQPANLALPAFKTMLEHLDGKIHFAILNGDWLYEEKREYTVPDWLEQVGQPQDQLPGVVEIAPTIVGVWENYKLYLERGKNLAAWHREIPSFFVFDDHEILNDVNGTGTVGLRNRRAVFRDIGVQAWYDYLGWSNPISHQQKIQFGRARLIADQDVLVDASADFRELNLNEAATLLVHWGGPTAGVNDTRLDKVDGDPNAGVYEIAEVLDTRSHRQMHDIRDPFKAGVSLLGNRQKSWLKQSMASSNSDFLFVVSSVNLMVPHVLPGPEKRNKDEAWTAVAAEREELIKFWDSLGKPVLVLTGDLHNSFAIKITDRVWEFASGPHNSGNHTLAAESNRPPNGEFESGGRHSEIRWSTFFPNDIGGPRRRPVYGVVKVNNVFRNPRPNEQDVWVAYPRPQVIVQYYDGLNGDLLYAESILASQ
ncbi:alkaline phosphatase D family protein [Acidobacteria bacterium AH-259-G07]|nr:alkaline phosphatase D family protein [Acidobacteria bacterium AH-259-G07]